MLSLCIIIISVLRDLVVESLIRLLCRSSLRAGSSAVGLGRVRD